MENNSGPTIEPWWTPQTKAADLEGKFPIFPCYNIKCPLDRGLPLLDVPNKSEWLNHFTKGQSTRLWSLHRSNFTIHFDNWVKTGDVFKCLTSIWDLNQFKTNYNYCIFFLLINVFTKRHTRDTQKNSNKFSSK